MLSMETPASSTSVKIRGGVRSVTEARVTEAEDYLRELASNYSGTPYLDQARFLMSRLHMDRNEFDQAADYLAQIVEDGGTSAVARVARLRLARVRLHQRRYDDALEVLESGDSNSAFAARYHEVRGDVLLAQGHIDRARAEYEAALTADEQGLVDRGFVQNKLDGLTNVAPDAVADLPEPEPAASE